VRGSDLWGRCYLVWIELDWWESYCGGRSGFQVLPLHVTRFWVLILVRGTLGIDKTVPIGFSKIKLSFEVNTDADEQLLQKVLSVTERYCVVLQVRLCRFSCFCLTRANPFPKNLQTLKTPPAFESTITKH